MLSPGRWHEMVPRGRRANLLFRRHLLEQARVSPAVQRGLKEICRQDALFWINVFGFLYEPRPPVHGALPWCTFPLQDRAILDILECIEKGEDLCILKSRDMGASWMSLASMAWLWAFRPGNKFLMVSRKEHLVDKPGEPDSLFWKLDHLLKYQPSWLGLTPKKDYERRKLGYSHWEMGSSITGESTTGAAGVGGRATAVFIDEFSRIEEGNELLSGTADTTPCRIFNFTVFGTGNASHKLATRPDVRKLRLHWSEHPLKNKGMYRYDMKLKKRIYLDQLVNFPAQYGYIDDGKLRSVWYDAECRRRANDREVAMMLDIDFQGSNYQFFDSSSIAELKELFCRAPYVEGELLVDTETGRPIDWVTRVNGPMKLWMNLDGRGNPPRSRYAVGCDISLGTGATNSCMSAIDIETGEKVLEFASPFMRPDVFATKVHGLLLWLRDNEGSGAYAGWEMQGPGLSFSKRILELGYRNIYYRVNEATVSKKFSDQPGWIPTLDNKRLVFEDYRTALAQRTFINRSSFALEECLNIIHLPNGAIDHSGAVESQDPTGARVNHGDRVVADALAWKLAKERQTPRKAGEVQVVKPGSLAWRRELADRDRQLEEAWA